MVGIPGPSGCDALLVSLSGDDVADDDDDDDGGGGDDDWTAKGGVCASEHESLWWSPCPETKTK